MMLFSVCIAEQQCRCENEQQQDSNAQNRDPIYQNREPIYQNRDPIDRNRLPTDQQQGSIAQNQDEMGSLSNMAFNEVLLSCIWPEDSHRYFALMKPSELNSQYGDYRKSSTWYKVTNNDGSVSFKDFDGTNCIKYMGPNKEADEKPCNLNDPDMQFDLETTGNGANLLKFKSNGYCFNMGTPFAVSPCQPSNPKFQWKFIPPVYGN